MPSPREEESKKDFISRCMGHSEMNSKFPNREQRYAVCQSYWDKKGKGEESDVDALVDEIYKPNKE